MKKNSRLESKNEVYFEKPIIANEITFFVCAWNNAVGFQQLHIKDLELETFENVIEEHFDDVSMFAIEVDTYNYFQNSKRYLILNTDNEHSSVISIARQMIYDPSKQKPKPLTKESLQKYNILSGFAVEHEELHVSEFAEEITEFIREDKQVYFKRQFLVYFKRKTLYFALERNPYNNDVVLLTIPGNDKCVNVNFHLDDHTATLESLFHNITDKQISCYNLATFGNTGVGTWMLQFVDQLNTLLNIQYCKLTDVSIFNGASAACLYSRNHHGLSWYASNMYLIQQEEGDDDDEESNDEESNDEESNDKEDLLIEYPKPHIEACIEASNRYISDLVSFWNTATSETTLRRDITPSEQFCTNVDCRELIKFYGSNAKNIALHIPKNRLHPAVFTNTNEKVTLELANESELETRTKMLLKFKDKAQKQHI